MKIHTFTCGILGVFLIPIFFIAKDLDAAQEAASCYEFEIPNYPERSTAETTLKQLWCYQKVVSPEGSLFIFNADETPLRSELTLLVEPDGTITHGSLLSGEVSFHRVDGKKFNPFPVPINEPIDKKPVSDSSKLNISTSEALGKLLAARSNNKVERFELEEGEISAVAQTKLKPWRGFWWPYQGQPLSEGQNSPMAKLDRYIMARTGKNSGAASWENRIHRYKGVKWEGHCNGWVGSSILRRQPTFARHDSVSGVTFTIDDQKGLLAEKDYCAIVAFFGSRNRGRSTDDPRDIYPHLFHKTLVYYIGQLKKPVALDYYANSVVDNHIISGYNMQITQTGSSTFRVVARLTVHQYDKERNHEPGVAPIYTRVYSYTLIRGENGDYVGGRWESTNPDFLWVPLSSTHCQSSNPFLREEHIQGILNLPSAN